MVALACPPAFAATRMAAGDVVLLNDAVESERAAIKAYGTGIASGYLSHSVTGVLNEFLNDHTAHLGALMNALSQAGRVPSDETAPLDVPPLHAEADVLNFAYTIERTAAAKYLDQIPQCSDRDLAKTIASILAVDATHVALLAEALLKNPAYPTGFITT
jgi:rubrerythrin